MFSHQQPLSRTATFIHRPRRFNISPSLVSPFNSSGVLPEFETGDVAGSAVNEVLRNDKHAVEPTAISKARSDKAADTSSLLIMTATWVGKSTPQVRRRHSSHGRRTQLTQQ